MGSHSAWLALETTIRESLELRKRLKACRLSESQEGVEVFYYKGAIYDREKFVCMEVNRLRDAKYSVIKKTLADAEKALDRGSANAELIAAHISAYLRVLAEKKKPMFYIDDGHGLY